MTHLDRVAIARAADAEVIGAVTPAPIKMLLDSSSTGGVVSVIQTSLAAGANGAFPHTHKKSAELFYVISGKVDILAGEQVITATEGDLVVVPPHLPHAFAATPDSRAELLIVIAPGIERFEYFRNLAQLRSGNVSAAEFAQIQERYDNWFLHSPAWTSARRIPT